ncbi:MAG: hypothetical protein ACOC8C_02545 [Chloroflexota bacterium]
MDREGDPIPTGIGALDARPAYLQMMHPFLTGGMMGPTVPRGRGVWDSVRVAK